MIKKLILTVFVIGVVMTSCSSDDDGINPTTAELRLNLNGLEPLGEDFVYEGWIIVDGSPVSTGTFTSVASSQTFVVNASDLANATTFVLSIEPAVDPDPAPAATKVLAGDFTGDTAAISTGIVGDFSSAAGAFFLRTPTDEMGMNNGNDENGVWFGTPDGATVYDASVEPVVDDQPAIEIVGTRAYLRVDSIPLLVDSP